MCCPAIRLHNSVVLMPRYGVATLVVLRMPSMASALRARLRRDKFVADEFVPIRRLLAPCIAARVLRDLLKFITRQQINVLPSYRRS